VPSPATCSLAVLLLLLAAGCGSSPTSPTAPPSGGPATFVQHTSEHFVFHHTAIDGSSITTTAASLERDYARITAELAVRATPRVQVYLYTTREWLQAAVRPTVGELPPFATGLVTGADAIHILSPRLAAVWSYENGVENIAHELAHCVSLVINPRIANNPRWLWESVALYEAGQFVHPRTLPYLAGGAGLTLESLNTFDHTRVYDVGYVIAEFIVSRWGLDGLIALIASNGNLAAVTGLNAAEFESAWRTFVRSRYGV
jgi:hypothetical protein